MSDVQHIKKQVPLSNGEFKQLNFVRLYGSNEMYDWCVEHYGPSRYPGAWTRVGHFILMEERTYVHWMLCK